MGVSAAAQVAPTSTSLSSSAICFGFFFFQAEDGIRDIGVTGVQTCALPIFGLCACWAVQQQRLNAPNGQKIGEFAPFLRSEERRVGKECRCRWSPYH